MAKFLVEIYLDGYETEEEHDKACADFIYDQLNFTASCVTIEALAIEEETARGGAEGGGDE